MEEQAKRYTYLTHDYSHERSPQNKHPSSGGRSSSSSSSGYRTGTVNESYRSLSGDNDDGSGSGESKVESGSGDGTSSIGDSATPARLSEVQEEQKKDFFDLSSIKSPIKKAQSKGVL